MSSKRKATFEAGLCFIELTKGYYFWCPEEAYRKVLEYWERPLDSINWRAVHNPKQQDDTIYAIGRWGPGPSNARDGRRNRQLAAVICEAYHGPAPEGYTIDHINHYTLYGGIEELRWASRAEQQVNRRSWLKKMREEECSAGLALATGVYQQLEVVS